jgi:hypothetical protein
VFGEGGEGGRLGMEALVDKDVFIADNNGRTF